MDMRTVLLPLFVEVVLTFVLLSWLAILRQRDFKRGVRREQVALREPNWSVPALQVGNCFANQLELPVRDDELYLSRTHPLVESLAAYVMDAALDTTTGNESVAKRCGVMRTSQVEKRTTLLLVRMRYHIITAQRSRPESTVLAEDCQVLAFQGAPASAQWLDDKAWIEQLLEAQPDGNVYEDQARQFLRQLLAGIEHLQPHLEQVFQQRAQELADAHRRVRQATQIRGLQSRVEPQMPLDLLGVYLYLPNVAR